MGIELCFMDVYGRYNYSLYYSWGLITSITIVYDTYDYRAHGVYKPTNITTMWPHPPVISWFISPSN